MHLIPVNAKVALAIGHNPTKEHRKCSYNTGTENAGKDNDGQNSSQ